MKILLSTVQLILQSPRIPKLRTQCTSNTGWPDLCWEPLQELKRRAGEMAQGFRALASPLEDTGSIPSTQKVAHNHPVSQDPMPSSDFQGRNRHRHGAHTYIETTYSYK